MAQIYRFLIVGFLYCLTLMPGWATVCVPDFGGVDVTDPNALKARLLREHIKFQIELDRHPVYQPSKAITNPLIDYICWLASYSSEDRNVAIALDYLLKTGGPFGFSDRPANEQEKVFIAGAVQVVAIRHRERATVVYTSRNPLHSAEVRRLQELAIAAGGPQHPYHDTITLPPSAAPLAADLKPELRQGGRWQLWLGLLGNRTWADNQFAATIVTGNAKADWLNDILLTGCMLGLVPDMEGSPSPRVRNYLDDAWKRSNEWMEAQHNYVQWWFIIHTVGMGDGIAPRYIHSTYLILVAHPAILAAIQQMLRMSFARNVTFWGQKFGAKGKIVPLDEADKKHPDLKLLLEENASKPAVRDWHDSWLTRNGRHNILRMSRYLRCLWFFGLRRELDDLYAYLEETVTKRHTDSYIQGSLKNHWSQAKGGRPGILERDAGDNPTKFEAQGYIPPPCAAAAAA
jgi:hypothetical protein